MSITFPLVPTPSPPLAGAPSINASLGVDILCEEDLDPRIQLVGGVRNVAWATAWRIRTPRGKMFYSPDYGRGLVDLCHDEVSRQTLHACRSGIETEALKDERLNEATSTVRWTPATRTLSTALACKSAAGPFRVVASIAEAETTMRVMI